MQVKLCHSEDIGCESGTEEGQNFINNLVAVTKMFTRKVDFSKGSDYYYNSDHYTGFFSLVKSSYGRNLQYV